MPKNGTSPDGGNSQQESLTHEQMQRIIQTGEQASKLLGSPVYNIAYQQLLNTKFQEWLTSDPKEERKRESLFLQAKALTEMTDLLGDAVADAQTLLQNQQAENDPGQRRQDYENEQGFGLSFQ